MLLKGAGRGAASILKSLYQYSIQGVDEDFHRTDKKTYRLQCLRHKTQNSNWEADRNIVLIHKAALQLTT